MGAAMQPLEDDSDLVEPEGVNASSAAQVDEPGQPAPDSEPGFADESGQDSGLMQ